jgi:hypothetical protein
VCACIVVSVRQRRMLHVAGWLNPAGSYLYEYLCLYRTKAKGPSSSAFAVVTFLSAFAHTKSTSLAYFSRSLRSAP